MKLLKGRRIYVSLIAAAIFGLLMIFPLFLELMGFNRIQASGDMRGAGLIPIDGLRVLESLIFYFAMIFILLIVFTYKSGSFLWTKKIIVAVAIASLFYIFSPLIYHPQPGKWGPPENFGQGFQGKPEEGVLRKTNLMIFKFDNPHEARKIIEFSFILLTTGLIGKVFELLSQKEVIEVENQKLRAENLQSQYNILVNQVNPHFFFNSMNSLSALVREGRKDNALRYIGELSNTYRYAMQNSGKEMVTLEEELKVLSAYCYMLLIRYEGKLFFNTDVDKGLMKMMLPVFSLQPLVENVIKHNSMTAKKPVTVLIKGYGEESLVITNQIIPRQEKAEAMGIGLKNLSTRYRLLTGKEIKIEDDGEVFCVTLPLKKGDTYEDINS